MKALGLKPRGRSAQRPARSDVTMASFFTGPLGVTEIPVISTPGPDASVTFCYAFNSKQGPTRLAAPWITTAGLQWCSKAMTGWIYRFQKMNLE